MKKFRVIATYSAFWDEVGNVTDEVDYENEEQWLDLYFPHMDENRSPTPFRLKELEEVFDA